MNKETDFNKEEKMPVNKFSPEQRKDARLRLEAMREAIQESKARRDRQEDENKDLS